MRGHLYKPGCKCDKNKKCTCKATWSYIVDIGIDPKTGKRKQKKKGGFKTKKEAQNALAELINELASGNYTPETNITFEEFAKQWLELYQSYGHIKISTTRVRKHEIEKLLDYFAKLKIKDITRKQYQDALLDLHHKGYAYNTISGIHSTGRSIFRRAVELEILKKDPTEFAKIPKTQKTILDIEKQGDLPRYLEKEELKLFLQTAKNCGLHLDYEVFYVLSYTGMRVGELCALQENSIDEDEQIIRITKTYYNPKNNIQNYMLLPPKTKTSIREIDVDSNVIKILNGLILENKKKMLKSNREFHNERFIFSDENGYPFYPKKIEIRMARILKIAGLKTNLTPHSLRHTHTSLLAEAGVNLEQIMQRLGHKNEDTTRNVYLHVTKDMKKEASQKFRQLMENL